MQQCFRSGRRISISPREEILATHSTHKKDCVTFFMETFITHIRNEFTIQCACTRTMYTRTKSSPSLFHQLFFIAATIQHQRWLQLRQHSRTGGSETTHSTSQLQKCGIGSSNCVPEVSDPSTCSLSQTPSFKFWSQYSIFCDLPWEIIPKPSSLLLFVPCSWVEEKKVRRGGGKKSQGVHASVLPGSN